MGTDAPPFVERTSPPAGPIAPADLPQRTSRDSAQTLFRDPRAGAMLPGLMPSRRTSPNSTLRAGRSSSTTCENWSESGYIFTTEEGQPLDPRRTSKAFNRHLRAAALPRIPLHGLRHTYATLALS